MESFSNKDVARLLRGVAAALTLKKASIFQTRAYEGAADAIEHLSSEIKDLWEEDRLSEVPGIGQNISGYLNELFSQGEVTHFKTITQNLPEVFFQALEIPGVGPKTAQKIASLGVKSLTELKEKLEKGEIQAEKISEKTADNILKALKDIKGGKDRMLLPYAGEQANRILDILRECPEVERAESLGSLRRKLPTIGDLDFAISSNNPKEAIDYFCKMPGIARVVNRGENKATLLTSTGLHIDLLIGKPGNFGALMQHFTGSKFHNIHLRSLAEQKGYSISEYGVKKLNAKLMNFTTEEELYELLGMQTPAPEIREDTGEIEAALNNKLPKLIEYSSFKGEVHLHSNYPIEPSHDFGANSMQEIIQKAIEKGYKYVGLSDHSPAVSGHSEEDFIRLIKGRGQKIKELQSKYPIIKILNGLEVDITTSGEMSVPDSALKQLDYCIAGVHSSHQMNKEDMTRRILKALENPHVSILAHPTGRLLNQRQSSDADWEKIFKFCAQEGKILEINAYPDRLDLREDLVRQAVGLGVKLIINTDAHEISQMDFIDYGVSVARRGWATREDIINAWEFTIFAKRLLKV